MLKSLLIPLTIVLFLNYPTAPMEIIDSETGAWPKTWPTELEPLRKQSVSGRGGQVMNPFHRIRFKKDDRQSFETAWPHITSLKSEGTTLTLIDAKRYFTNDDGYVAGVTICPPMDGANSGQLSQTRISLFVDGSVIDLNRIQLPANTPIEDTRFKNAR